MRHRVVVVGGGFGGLPACRFLGNLPVDVTLIDRRNHHLFQPLLYQVATGILSPGQIAPPLRHVLRKHKNVKVELAEVDRFDLDRKVVIAKRLGLREMEVPYDSLIVAAGANQSYFGHDEFALFAPGMKTIDDALELRRRIFGAFEMAEIAIDAQEQREWLTILVVGAGPTGVEVAGQIRELALRSLSGDFRTFDPTSVRVVILDGGEEPLATFGHDLSPRRRPRARQPRRRAAHGRARHEGRRTRRRRVVARRDDRAHRRPHRDLGGGGPGVAARREAGGGVRRRGRPRRPHQGVARPHPARSSRGVRGRRHDLARQPARRGRGGDAGQPARRAHHRPSGARRRRVEAVRVPRPR